MAQNNILYRENGVQKLEFSYLDLFKKLKINSETD